VTANEIKGIGFEEVVRIDFCAIILVLMNDLLDAVSPEPVGVVVVGVDLIEVTVEIIEALFGGGRRSSRDYPAPTFRCRR